MCIRDRCWVCLDRFAFDVITLPPLRERQEDILVLAEHFAISMAKELEWELFSGFSRKAKELLLDYHWPGNVRELKNVVERSVYRSANPHVPVHEIVLDPFSSPFRPQGRVKTQDRQTSQTASVNTVETVTNITEQSTTLQTQTERHTFSFPVDFKQSSQDYEIDLIKAALSHSQFNQKKTADQLGVTYHQLRGYLKKYNLLDKSVED